MKEIAIGLLASVFFAVTFVLNRSMELSGGSWMWSASLRFLFMLPFFVVIVAMRGTLRQLLSEMKQHPAAWIVWSFFGFVLFYAPITYAAASGPGWLIGGTWQLTIVAGVLLTPLFGERKNGQMVRHKIPLGALAISCVILVGIAMLQLEKSDGLTLSGFLTGVLPVLIAAFAYPLGNRKMMELCGGRIDTFSRILGMILASLPFWLLLSALGWGMDGAPSSSQLTQTFIVGLSSGVIATTLFFIATDRSRNNPGRLASVEATQSAQVLFTLIGEVLLFGAALPGLSASVGLALIIIGMILHSWYTKKLKERELREHVA
ncbi:DMT family transporter [Domibacillus robiginosus]|uniref:DMT family transporter n=1 Tax=Domibacillus robiginosus TaxID=1071054 RepID=UPI00067C5567|nr:multidrug resistance efflux transporter family protein [Domibacillus robiginosus]